MPETKTILTKESEGPEVAYLQGMLKIMGYRFTDPNGVFNFDTEHQVKSFQADYELAINGVVDEATWQTIESALGKSPGGGLTIPYFNVEIPWWGFLIIGAVAGGLIAGLIVRRKQ